MLRATEQLSWQSTLARFKRGYEDITNAADTSADGDNKDHVDWQLFSGKHLRCKVTFTKAIDKSRPSQASQSRTGSLTLEELADRQLRIIVECGPAGSDDSRKGGKGSKGMTALGSGSQPIPPLLLVDVDLVRINKAYFHTEQRLKAVIVYRQNKCVLIRMLDEFESSKAHRLQLEFNREEDVESFLSLIEPDSTFHDACRKGLPKKESRNCSDTSKSAADGKVSPMLEEKSYDTKTVAFDDAQPGSQSQGLGEKLLQLNQIRGRRPVESVSAQFQTLPSSESQSQNVGSPSASCPNCAHTIRPHSSETTTSSSDAKAPHDSTSDNITSLSLRQTQTPTTEMTDASVYEQVDEDDEDLDDGLYGWPDPSAVECIQDDVRRLCLTDPYLDHMIAHCVEKYFRELRQL